MTKATHVQVEQITLDAKGKSFGRLASQIAFYLQGKHQAAYQPNLVAPIRVTVTNLGSVKFTGNKLDTTMRHKHTGYTGHLKSETFRQAFVRSQEKVLRDAVRRMLPKNRLQTKRLKNLYIEA